MGVVVVTYNSGPAVLDCLESLLAAEGIALSIIVVDNASPDGTADVVADWASGAVPYRPPDARLPFALDAAPKPVAAVPEPGGGSTVTLIRAPENGGFAAGVNLGLAALSRDPQIQMFWVLNPDCVVPPQTPARLAAHPQAQAPFALMGCRIFYLDPPDRIQGDGGRINWLTGVTTNYNARRRAAEAEPVSPARIDFANGASMVASRAFYERAGPMPEQYFLYYEEVDWAQRRQELPLLHCPGAAVFHVGGASIGSPGYAAAPSAFSCYYLFRARMMFLRRYRRRALAPAYLFALLKAGQMLARGHRAQARAILQAVNGRRFLPGG